MCQHLPSQLAKREQFWQAQGCPVSVRARIGVASGYCTLGDWGNRRLDYSVIGPAVNLAHRLQQHAVDGALLDAASAGLFGPSQRLGPPQQLAIQEFGQVTAYPVVAKMPAL